MALALLLLSKTKTKYCAERHRKENEHREDGACRNYADSFHLPLEEKLDYIIGEDEKGKFVKFEKDGAQATIRFDATNAAESLASTKQILGSVFERTAKHKMRKGEEKDETSILPISCIDKRTSRS